MGVLIPEMVKTGEGAIQEVECRTGIQFWICDAGFDLTRAWSMGLGQEKRDERRKVGRSTLNE